MRPFSKIAPYYETLMDGVPYPMWLAYLKLIWAKLDRAPRTVLEVCCGTGRMCRMLAEEGFSLTGVDLSRPMIREASRLAKEACLRVRYEVQDAAELDLGERFDAAFSFFDSLNNITDPGRLAKALRRVRDHLAPGGPFLFDLNTDYAFKHKMFDQKDRNRRRRVRYEWRSRWDPESRLCTIEMDFWTKEGEFREVHVQRAYSVEEIEAMMQDAGFRRVETFDAYTLDPPRGRSDRIHVLGVAPE
ncbi:MAG: class I SAM-dependent methyltransferase [Armatimonadetes bacterium]|nr:class I SAM-dependent methyltransferase [Armatimonadota bacterium]